MWKKQGSWNSFHAKLIPTQVSFNNVYGRSGSYVTAGEKDYAERMNQIEAQKEEYYKQLGVAPSVPTEKGAYGDPENTGVGYNTVITNLGDHTVLEGWVQTPKHNDEQGSNLGGPISWNDPTSPDAPQAGYGYIPNDTTKEETFFFHSDHLGSTSYITDDKGNITQYDVYLPYGELLVDEHSSSEDMPYKFNGKEMDSETGLYYYGARYMNPVTSLWYGVDPLTEDYENISSYLYCHANPLVMIDPTGEGDYFTKSGNYLGYDNKNNGKAYFVTGDFNMNDYLQGKLGKQTSISEINLNDDIGQLARIGYAEFRGGNSTEQLAGMDIVMNRVKSDKFPNTIEGVIVQPWQFSSLNKNDNNRIFYTNPSKTLKIQSGKHKGELDKLNHNAWVKSLSNAIKVSNGSKRGISKSALLYYSPRSMTKDKKGNPTLPKWDFSKLKEIYVDGVRTSYIRMYNYKETKKKGQKQ